MVIGLLKPTEGQIEVFGHTARPNKAESLARVGYVAQNHPLYPEFSVADMFRLGQAMNPAWDMGMARARMEAFTAISEVTSPGAAMRRSLMPVRSVIQASEVSTTLASSSLVTIVSGR